MYIHIEILYTIFIYVNIYNIKQIYKKYNCVQENTYSSYYRTPHPNH